MKTTKQNKARSEKMKAYWAKRRAEKEAAEAPLKEKYAALREIARLGAEIDAQPPGPKWVVSAVTSSNPKVVAVLDDAVNHPSHYTFGKYEVIDVLEDWFATEPLLWQVGKYIARWDKKGDPVENLEKAAFYLNRKIAKLKGK